MTYDILSRLEDSYIGGEEITNKLVDDTIYEIYLRNFKQPPIIILGPYQA